MKVRTILTLETCEASHVVSAESRVDCVIGVVCGHVFLVSQDYFAVLQSHSYVLAMHYWMIYSLVYLMYLTLQVGEILMNTFIHLCMWSLFVHTLY